MTQHSAHCSVCFQKGTIPPVVGHTTEVTINVSLMSSGLVHDNCGLKLP